MALYNRLLSRLSHCVIMNHASLYGEGGEDSVKQQPYTVIRGRMMVGLTQCYTTRSHRGGQWGQYSDIQVLKATAVS